MMKEYLIAIVEVGERYVTRAVSTRAKQCSMKEAQKIARDAGYQVIDNLCYIVPTTHEVHIVIAVEAD
jgi:hypothetical protein